MALSVIKWIIFGSIASISPWIILPSVELNFLFSDVGMMIPLPLHIKNPAAVGPIPVSVAEEAAAVSEAKYVFPVFGV